MKIIKKNFKRIFTMLFSLHMLCFVNSSYAHTTGDSCSKMYFTFYSTVKSVPGAETDVFSIVDEENTEIVCFRQEDMMMTMHCGSEKVVVPVKMVKKAGCRFGFDIDFDSKTITVTVLSDADEYHEFDTISLSYNGDGKTLRVNSLSDNVAISEQVAKNKNPQNTVWYKELFSRSNVKVDHLDDIKAELSDGDLIFKNGSPYVIAKNARIKLDKLNDIIPFSQNDEQYFPIRTVADLIGAELTYNAADHSVTVVFDSKTLKLDLNGKSYTIDGKPGDLKNAVTLIEGKTAVSANLFAGWLGKNVSRKNELTAICGEGDAFDGKLSEVYERVSASFGSYIEKKDKTATKLFEEISIEINKFKNKKGIPEGGMTVFVPGGIYTAEETVEIEKEFSGNKAAPVEIQGYDGEVSITGALSLKYDDFKKITDNSVLDRLYPNVRNLVKVVNLKDFGITSVASPRMYRTGHTSEDPVGSQLFIDNKVMTNSRWPNGSWGYTGTVLNATEWPGGVIEAGNAPMERWKYADNVFISGYLKWAWAYDITKVRIDYENQTFVTETRSSYGAEANKPYYVFNLLEEIDSPGEWFVDVKTLKLYVYFPETTTADSDIRFAGALSKPMVNIKDASYLSINNIRFSETTQRGLQIEKSRNIDFISCTFTNIMDRTIQMKDVEYCKIRSCDFTALGNGGITLENTHLEETLRDDGNMIDNCYFNDFGRYLVSSNAITINSVGTTVKNCEISCASSSVIGGYGQNYKIINNEIFDTVMDSDDFGAIYTGRTWVTRGWLFENNVFHHNSGKSGKGVHGIYIDDGEHGHIYKNNLFYKGSSSVDIKSNLRDINAEGNIFIREAGTETAISPLGDLGPDYIYKDGVWYEDGGMDYSNQPAIDNNYTIIERLTVSPWRNIFWKNAYPSLYGILDEKEYMSGMKNGIVKNNLSFGTEVMVVPGGEWESNDFFRERFNNVYENNIKTDDKSVFADFDNCDFTVVKDLGFDVKVGPDINKVGILKSKDRQEMPAIEEFNLVYPVNGARDIDPRTLSFVWEKPVGSALFKIVIAEDKDFNHIVYEKEMRMVTGFEFDSVLNYGEKTYFWKVMAYDNSMRRQEIKESEKVFSFTTIKSEPANVSGVSELLTNYEKLVINTPVGTTVGCVSEATKNDAETLISEMKTALEGKIVASQTREMEKRLVAATDAFKASRNIGNVDLVKYLDPQSSNWQANNINNMGRRDDGFRIEAESTNETAALFGYNEKLPNYPIWTFNAEFNATNSLWNGIMLRSSSPRSVAWSGGSNYIVIVKKDTLEFQSFGVTTGTRYNVSVPNTFIENGKKHLIEFGTVDMPDGGVHIIFKVDGKTVFDFEDTQEGHYIKNEGFVTFVAPLGAPMDISSPDIDISTLTTAEELNRSDAADSAK